MDFAEKNCSIDQPHIPQLLQQLPVATVGSDSKPAHLPDCSCTDLVSEWVRSGILLVVPVLSNHLGKLSYKEFSSITQVLGWQLE